jgi:hypothetical protein
MILSFSPFLSDEEDPKRLAAAAPVTYTIVIDEPPPQEVDPATKPQKASKKPAKRVVGVHHSGRLQKAFDAAAILEAHQSTGSFDDVPAHTVILYLLQLWRVYTHVLFAEQDLMKRFVALGNECVKYQKIAKASEGKSPFRHLFTFGIPNFASLLDCFLPRCSEGSPSSHCVA